MIIECLQCSKKFNISDNLVPDEGRLLKCGNCNNTWFYSKKEKIKNTVNNEKREIVENKKLINEEQKKQKTIKKEKIYKPKQIKIKKSISKELVSVNEDINDKETNLLKKTFVIIISLLAIILLVDTFKIQISSVFPEIIMAMDSLYIVINDLKLFIKDLLR